MKRKVIVFDLWGDLAHFRKPYTTTSPLTYSIPSGTALAGILGAITGKQKNSYFTLFEKGSYSLAIGIKESIKKLRIALNLIDTKSAIKMSKIKNRTQIRTEFLQNPHYRIYFSHSKEEFYQEVKKNLQEHTAVYTISLGLSGNLANFSYLGEYEAKEVENLAGEFIPITSVIRNDGYSAGDVDFSQGEFFTETVPMQMKEGREVTDYAEILFESRGKPIPIKVKRYWEIEGLQEKVVFI